ncbi:hypothetical protein [Ruficoccus sp. ZRK36]|uniref:hypothetical protein n=1 Tax=Ruficoccus sp. ZRK36 TaxID=2866311 RepID=UPI001C735273|nr:hypothetical protein [Ruficoccus sp. ZRK36]QYY37234.1 hypothetical protein K0V07_07060 [Ruficoccus sp. ZRK36]
MSIRSISTILLLATLATGSTQAQQKENVSLKFATLSLGSSIPDCSYSDTTGVHTLFITNASHTELESYNGPAQLTFYKGKNTSENINTRTPIASVNLSGMHGKWLFVFSPTGNGRYQVFPVPYDRANSAPGSWLVYNLTQSPLVFKAGSQTPISIQQQSQQVIRSNQTDRKGEQVQMAVPDNGKWKRVYSSIWQRNPDALTLVFLFPQGQRGGVSVKRVNLVL